MKACEEGEETYQEDVQVTPHGRLMHQMKHSPDVHRPSASPPTKTQAIRHDHVRAGSNSQR